MSNMPATGFNTGSKLLQKKWEERNMKLHQQKLRGMKAGLNNKTPRKYPHLVLRLKAVQKTEERQAQIEHDNQLLLQKMTSIMRKKGRIDNWNDYESRSLNFGYREREQERIALENRKLARSLEGVKPLIKMNELEDNYKDHQYYLDLWSTDTKDWQLTPRLRGDEYESDFEDDVSQRDKLPAIDSRESLRSKTSLMSDETAGAESKRSAATKTTEKLPKITKNPLTENDAKLLFKACKSLVDPEEVIVKTLIKRSEKQRRANMERFVELYELNLLTELRSAVHKDLHLLLELLIPTQRSDAQKLNKAIHANDPPQLAEALYTLSNAALKSTKELYKNEFEATLEEDIEDRILDDNSRQLLLALADGTRQEGTKLDQSAADKDASNIFNAGENRFTDSSGIFLQVMRRRTSAHMKVLFNSYKMASGGKDIIEDMKDCGCNKVYCNTVKKIGKTLDGSDYWAARLHDNMRPNSKDFIVTAMLKEEEATSIKKSYKTKYGSDLTDDINGRCGKKLGPMLVHFFNKTAPTKKVTMAASFKPTQTSPAQKSIYSQRSSPVKHTPSPSRSIKKEQDRSQGTVRSAAAFDMDRDVTAIKEALLKWHSDTEPLSALLAERSNKQRQAIRQRYREMEGKDLLEVLKRKTGPAYEAIMTALIMGPAEYYVNVLEKAVKEENAMDIISIICTITPKELRSVQSQYKADTSKILGDDVTKCSDSIGPLLGQIVRTQRDEGSGVDHKLADTNATQMSKESAVAESQSFKDLVCRRSLPQIKATFERFKKVSGGTIKDALKKDKLGAAEKSYLHLVQALQDNAEYFAWRLHDSLSNSKTSDTFLIRICLSRSEIDLVQIKLKYKQLFGQTLESAIEKNCSADFKNLLLKIV